MKEQQEKIIDAILDKYPDKEGETEQERAARFRLIAREYTEKMAEAGIWVITPPPDSEPYQIHREKAECVDGFHMSVQASRGHYSCPRNNTGPYSEVEVGFPSERESLLDPFVEPAGWADDDCTITKEPEWTETVYPYVPTEVVEEVIEKHGGMTGGELPPFKNDMPHEPIPIDGLPVDTKWRDQ